MTEPERQEEERRAGSDMPALRRLGWRKARPVWRDQSKRGFGARDLALLLVAAIAGAAIVIFFLT